MFLLANLLTKISKSDIIHFMNDIFDITDLDDLPTDLISQLKLGSHADAQILKLFLLANRPLNLTQLLVGYYRTYKEEKTRNYMMTFCYRLEKKGFLDKTGKKGEYVINDKGKKLVESEMDEGLEERN